jgi:fatty acid desaturase (delta-4 desaturase)
MHHPPHTFTLHTVTTTTTTGTDTSTLIACSRRPLPAEQAVTWAQTVLAAVTPAAVLVVCSILSMDYRGPGDAAEENLIFGIHTQNSSATTTTAAVVPVLPPGTLISGLPAALLEESESLKIPGSILVAVESSPVPEVSLVCGLADAVSKMVMLGGDLDGERRAAVAEAVNSMFRSSASNSMFI